MPQGPILSLNLLDLSSCLPCLYSMRQDITYAMFPLIGWDQATTENGPGTITEELKALWSYQPLNHTELSTHSLKMFVSTDQVFTHISELLFAFHLKFPCCGFTMKRSQLARFMGPTRGPPGSCRPQMGPMLAPWTLLSVIISIKEAFSVRYGFPQHESMFLDEWCILG